MDPESGTGTGEPSATGAEGSAASVDTGVSSGRERTAQETVDAMLAEAEAEHQAALFGLPESETSKPGKAAETKYKVKVEGKEEEVSLSELLSGYSRQADYTRKTQALAAERQRLDAQQRALFESEAFKAVKAMAEKEVGEFDPYDPDNMLNHMRKTAAEQLASLYRPVEEAYASETAKVKATAFISSKPEFEDPTFKAEVREMLKSNQNLDLETAYWVAKGKRDSATTAAAKEEAARYRKAMAEAGLNVSTGSAVESDVLPPMHIRKQGAYAIASWLSAKRGRW